MISHQHRCIFVHIPRTAGTSIETWLQGSNMWSTNPDEKHLTSIQARQRYAAYWDDYFKFTIIRNPYERVTSLLRFPKHYGVHLREGAIRLGGYKDKYGCPITLEHDIRFTNYEDLLALEPIAERPYRPNCVYGNILTERLDAIYRFEDLSAAVASIAHSLSLPNPDLRRPKAPKRPVDPTVARNKRSIARINNLYREDFVKFDYPMIPTSFAPRPSDADVASTTKILN